MFKDLSIVLYADIPRPALIIANTMRDDIALEPSDSGKCNVPKSRRRHKWDSSTLTLSTGPAWRRRLHRQHQYKSCTEVYCLLIWSTVED